jgi:hypothetical protein
MDHPNIWNPDNNMSIDLSHPFKDDLLHCMNDDFQSYLRSCDAYSFEHLDMLNGGHFRPSSCSNLDGYKVVAIPEQS